MREERTRQLNRAVVDDWNYQVRVCGWVCKAKLK